jgi:hypothetical protein
MLREYGPDPKLEHASARHIGRDNLHPGLTQRKQKGRISAKPVYFGY